MKPKVLAVLLLAANMTFTSVSDAQIWGTGMYGGMQQCPYNNGTAKGAVDGDDEIHDLENTRRDLKRDKRDAEKQLRDLESRKDKYSDTIGESFAGGYGDSIKEHMENGYNCNCEAPVASYEPPVISGGPPPTYQPPAAPPVYQPAPPPYQPAPPPDEPTPEQPAPPPQPAPRPPHQSTDIFSPNTIERAPASEGSGRAPASDGRAPAQSSETMSAPPAQTSVRRYESDLDSDLGPGGADGGGGGSMCGPRTKLTVSRRWQQYCHDGGGVSKSICHDLKIATVDTRKRSTDCERAVAEYRKVTKQADGLRNKIARIEDQISQIGVQIGDLKRDRKDDRELEASCPTGTCSRSARHRPESDNSGFNWGSLVPLAAGVLGGLGAEYLGYKANQANNTNLNKLGFPTQPYQAGSYGLPFVGAGINGMATYGAVNSGANGAFGCANGPNGGGPYNPNMMGYGQYGNNNPFGYPNMFGMNPAMGGGMYNPGMGPWGMSGPWGNGNPYMGGGMAGGMAGMAGAPGLVGSLGFAGMPGMAGGMYGGMAGGMAGGLYGGMAGGFAGMAGGLAGMAGLPGMGGGLYGGIAGGIGLAGMPGMAGGLAGMAGMPGMAGGLYGGLYGGMAGGMATGFASPYGVAGGMAVGGGFLTPVSSPFGLAGGMQYQQQMQMQQMMGMQMQAAQQQQAQVRAQQGLMSEYYSLMYRMQQVNLGGGLSGSLGSGLVGSFGLGVGGGLGGGIAGGYGLSGSLGGSTYYSPTTLPISTTVPGRTR